MASIVNAIGDFLKSIYELFAAFFVTLYNLIQTLLSTVGTLFADAFNLVGGTIKGSLNVLGETGKFLIGNAFVIVIIGVGIVGYLQYMRSQGKPVVVGNKKLN